MPRSSLSMASSCHLCHLHNHDPEGLLRTSPLRSSRARSKYANKHHHHHYHGSPPHRHVHRSQSREEKMAARASALARLSDHSHSLPGSRSNSLSRYNAGVSTLPEGRGEYRHNIHSNSSAHSLEINPPILSVLEARSTSLPRGLTGVHSPSSIHPEPDILVNAMPRSRANSRAGSIPRTPVHSSQDNSQDYYLHFDRQRFKKEKTKKHRFNLQTVMLIGCYSVLVVIAIIVGVVVCYQNGWLGLGPPQGISGGNPNGNLINNISKTTTSRPRLRNPAVTTIQDKTLKQRPREKVILTDTGDGTTDILSPLNVPSSEKAKDRSANSNIQSSNNHQDNLNQQNIESILSSEPDMSRKHEDRLLNKQQPATAFPGSNISNVRVSVHQNTPPPSATGNTEKKSHKLQILENDPTVFKFPTEFNSHDVRPVQVLSNNRNNENLNRHRFSRPIPSVPTGHSFSGVVENSNLQNHRTTSRVPPNVRQSIGQSSNKPPEQSESSSRPNSSVPTGHSFSGVVENSNSQNHHTASNIRENIGQSSDKAPEQSVSFGDLVKLSSQRNVNTPSIQPQSNEHHNVFSNTRVDDREIRIPSASQTSTTQQLLDLLIIRGMRDLLRSQGDTQNILEILGNLNPSNNFRFDSFTVEEQVGDEVSNDPLNRSREDRGRSILRQASGNIVSDAMKNEQLKSSVTLISPNNNPIPPILNNEQKTQEEKSSTVKIGSINENLNLQTEQSENALQNANLAIDSSSQVFSPSTVNKNPTIEHRNTPKSLNGAAVSSGIFPLLSTLNINPTTEIQNSPKNVNAPSDSSSVISTLPNLNKDTIIENITINTPAGSSLLNIISERIKQLNAKNLSRHTPSRSKTTVSISPDNTHVSLKQPAFNPQRVSLVPLTTEDLQVLLKSRKKDNSSIDEVRMRNLELLRAMFSLEKKELRNLNTNFDGFLTRNTNPSTSGVNSQSPNSGNRIIQEIIRLNVPPIGESVSRIGLPSHVKSTDNIINDNERTVETPKIILPPITDSNLRLRHSDNIQSVNSPNFNNNQVRLKALPGKNDKSDIVLPNTNNEQDRKRDIRLDSNEANKVRRILFEGHATSMTELSNEKRNRFPVKNPTIDQINQSTSELLSQNGLPSTGIPPNNVENRIRPKLDTDQPSNDAKSKNQKVSNPEDAVTVDLDSAPTIHSNSESTPLQISSRPSEERNKVSNFDLIAVDEKITQSGNSESVVSHNINSPIGIGDFPSLSLPILKDFILSREDQRILSQGVNQGSSDFNIRKLPDPSFSVLVKTDGSSSKTGPKDNIHSSDVSPSTNLPRRELVAVQTGRSFSSPSVVRTWTHNHSDGTFSRGQIRSDGSFAFTNCKPSDACKS